VEGIQLKRLGTNPRISVTPRLPRQQICQESLNDALFEHWTATLSSGTIYSPHHPRFSWLFLAVFIIAASALFFEVTGTAFRDIGLSPMTAALVIGASLLGSYVNIPVAAVQSDRPRVTEEYVTQFGITYRIPRITPATYTIVAVNLGGAVIPSLVVIYLLSKYPSLLPQIVLGVAIVAIVTHAVARPTKGLGIVTPALVPPIAAAASALLIQSSAPFVIAYVSGVLGALVGADLTNLAAIPDLGAGIVSIGGGGTFDGVFLSGIIAVLLA